MVGLWKKKTPSPNPYAKRSTDSGDSMDDQMGSKEIPSLYDLYENINDNELYNDGIPQYKKSRLYQRSNSLKVSKVSEASSRLVRTGSTGLLRAADVLSTFGSTMSSLTSKDIFDSATTKNKELSIIAFEVANTIVKGSNLMRSLSNRSIERLNEVVFPSEGVQCLISTDIDELLRIFATDKREELKFFSREVVRFGNRCRDPQWHDLDRFFEKCSNDRTPLKQLRETAETAILELMTYVQLTSGLYAGMHSLDRIEQAYKLKCLEELRFSSPQKGDRDNGLQILKVELKNQRKVVKNLKKRSLWSKRMEEIMGKLVDIVLYLNQEINHTFGNPEASTSDNGKLGPSGLALHYANIILQIDSIVARPSSMPQSSRETLYQSLPTCVKESIRKKLQSFRADKELTVSEIKDKMESTLHWLAMFAINTAKAQHGFGWVGECANNGRDFNRKMNVYNEIERIETLHHADKSKTEGYIMDLLVWLNYLVNQSKPGCNGTSVPSHEKLQYVNTEQLRP